MNKNLNINLKFDLKPATILPLLKTAQPYLIGGILIAVFAYTAFVVNNALNVKSDPDGTSSVGVSFDKTTLNNLKNATTVPVTIAPATLGTTDPFGGN